MPIRVPVVLLAVLLSTTCRSVQGPGTLLPIAEIQGAGHRSALAGSAVRTSGIVTAVEADRFWIQDPEGDGAPSTSEGLLVFTEAEPAVAVGDEVTVSGTVEEFRPSTRPADLTLTELTRPTVTVRSAGNPLPAPIVIGADRLPPTEVVDDDGLARFEPDTDGLDFYESLEGMRVAVPDAMATSPINRFREVFVVANAGANATGRNAAGGVTLTVNAGVVDHNPERIKIVAARPAARVPDPVVDVGDSLGDVIGVLGYGFGNFEVHAEVPWSVRSGQAAPEITTLTAGGDVLTVATFNVENLDPNDEDGDTDVADGRFGRLARIIVEHLRAPDILGLQEIQDDDGAVDSDVISADATLGRLAGEVNALLGGDVYGFVDNRFIDDDASGGQPGGNIRVAFLYRRDRVSVVSGSERPGAEPNAQASGAGGPFVDSRLPLAVDFRFGGRRVTVVNNHFSSKGRGTPVFGEVQPFVNGSAEARRAQARAVNAFVDRLLADDPGAGVIVLGDLNEFWFDPIVAEDLAGSGADRVLDNLWLGLAPAERYSTVFEGNGQTLDHMLVTPNLRSRLRGFDAVHVNALFADQVSDHDPLVAAFVFPRAP